MLNLYSVLKSNWKWTVTQMIFVVFGFGLGKFGFSFNWLMFLMTANMRLLSLKNELQKSDFSRIIRTSLNEEEIIRAQLGSSNIPSWVKFPDYESSEWLNIILKRLWPFFCEGFQGPLLRKLNEINFVDGLKIEEFQFGDIVNLNLNTPQTIISMRFPRYLSVSKV